MPVTDTGKVQRKVLRDLFKEKNLASPRRQTEISESSDLQAKLISIWEDVLSIHPVQASDSFFDLGGDSLSAIRVSLAMEKAGLDRAICRKVFKGLSIRDLVNEVDGQEVNEVIEDVSQTQLGLGNQTLNFVRGLLVLLNIGAHWMPGVIERLPNVFASINRYFAPLYSSGTPGFAIIFGAGIGYYIYPRFQKKPSSVNALVLRNLGILGSGIIALAIVRIISMYANGVDITAMGVSNSTWSVITFYFFAVLSIPLWMYILSFGRWDFGFKSLLLAAVLYLIHVIVDEFTIMPSKNPFIQPFVLLLTAKFNYFEMSAGALMGAAFGHWFRLDIVKRVLLGKYIALGLASVLIGVVMSIELQQTHLWFKWPKGIYLWSWPLYLGLVLLVLSASYSYLQRMAKQKKESIALNVVSIIGVLAFPLFIVHEMVLPLKRALEGFGVPGSLPIAMGLFLVFTVYMTHHIYRLYFSK